MKGHAVVLDAGGDVDNIINALDGKQVDAIILTHGHFDHAGAADELAEREEKMHGIRPKIYGPEKSDAFLLKTIADQGRSFEIDDMRNVTPDEWTEEGKSLHLLGEELEVLHIPGHTPGHVVYYDRKGGRLMCGDTLFHGTIGRSDFDYGNGEQLIDNIQRKLLTLPDETQVLSGHGSSTTIAQQKVENPYLRDL